MLVIKLVNVGWLVIKLVNIMLVIKLVNWVIKLVNNVGYKVG